MSEGLIYRDTSSKSSCSPLLTDVFSLLWRVTWCLLLTGMVEMIPNSETLLRSRWSMGWPAPRTAATLLQAQPLGRTDEKVEVGLRVGQARGRPGPSALQGSQTKKAQLRWEKNTSCGLGAPCSRSHAWCQAGPELISSEIWLGALLGSSGRTGLMQHNVMGPTAPSLPVFSESPVVLSVNDRSTQTPFYPPSS